MVEGRGRDGGREMAGGWKRGGKEGESDEGGKEGNCFCVIVLFGRSL